MATTKISKTIGDKLVEALANPSYEMVGARTNTERAMIDRGLVFHGRLREPVKDHRGHQVRTHGLMLTDEGVSEAKRLRGEQQSEKVDETITREDVARGVEDALQWIHRDDREEWAAKGANAVLTREWKRAGSVWRKLAKQGGRIPVETQALQHYGKVEKLMLAARRFELEDSATAEAQPGQEVGFYVTVRNARQAGFLLGPYASKEEADDNVSRARQHAEEQVNEACFYEYGTARAVAKLGRTLPVGKFNDSIGLRAEEEGETVSTEETPVDRIKRSKTAEGVVESLRAPHIGHGDEGDVEGAAPADAPGQQYGGITREDVATGNGPAPALARAAAYFKMFDEKHSATTAPRAEQPVNAAKAAYEERLSTLSDLRAVAEGVMDAGAIPEYAPVYSLYNRHLAGHVAAGALATRAYWVNSNNGAAEVARMSTTEQARQYAFAFKPLAKITPGPHACTLVFADGTTESLTSYDTVCLLPAPEGA